MSDTLKIAQLDLRVVMPYRLQALIVLAIAPVLAFVTHDPRSVLPASVVYTSMLVGYPFAIGDKYDLPTLYGVLPIDRSRVVTGRYAFAFGIYVATAVVGLALTFAMAAALGVSITGTEVALLVTASLVLFVLVVALQFPLYFWLGYTKARVLGIVPFVVLFAAIVALAPSLKTAAMPPAGPLVAGGVVGAAALLTASVVLSRRLDARRVD